MSRIWADRVKTVIGTTLQERVLRPYFGSDVTQALFDVEDMATSDVSAAIAEAFGAHLPDLTLEEVVIDDMDEFETTMEVQITYSLPDKTLTTTSVGLVYGPTDQLSTEEYQ